MARPYFNAAFASGIQRPSRIKLSDPDDGGSSTLVQGTPPFASYGATER